MKKFSSSSPSLSVLPAGGDRLRQYDARGVDSLKETLTVDASRDFADENGGDTLRPQLLVDAEKVDFYHLFCPVKEWGERFWKNHGHRRRVNGPLRNQADFLWIWTVGIDIGLR